MLELHLAIGGASVCLSVTRWYWVTTNDRRIMHFYRRVDRALVFFATHTEVLGEPPRKHFKRDGVGKTAKTQIFDQ